jgi:hypothetical protein
MSKKSTSGVAAAVLLGLIMSVFSAPPVFAAAKHHRSVHARITAWPYYVWSPERAPPGLWVGWYYGPPIWGPFAYDPGPFGHPAFVGGTHHRG